MVETIKSDSEATFSQEAFDELHRQHADAIAECQRLGMVLQNTLGKPEGRDSGGKFEILEIVQEELLKAEKKKGEILERLLAEGKKGLLAKKESNG